MGCELNPKIIYTEFSAVVRKQKEILKKLIEKKQAQIRKVHIGLTCFREGVREIPVESIPGIVEAGWVPPPERPGSGGSRLNAGRSADDPDFLYNAFKTILNSTKNHQSAWPFLHPVDRKAVADYYDHIKYPMDLRTMSERLKSNYYCNRRLFIADIKRMFANCRAYNAPGFCLLDH